MDLDSAGFPHVAWSGSGGSFYAQRLGPHAWDLAALPAHELANIAGLVLDPNDQPHFLVTEAVPLYGRPPFARHAFPCGAHGRLVGVCAPLAGG